jgi:hypothetical protein
MTYAMVLIALAFGAGTGRGYVQLPAFDDPEQMVRALYAAVSFEPGAGADWDHVRAFFLPEAVFAVRRTATSMDVMNVDEFIAWFVADVERLHMVERGFEETVLKVQTTIFGDMGHAFVVYRARLKTPPDQRGQYGLDSFGLVHLDGRWWIASLTNDVVTQNRSLPEALTVPIPGR